MNIFLAICACMVIGILFFIAKIIFGFKLSERCTGRAKGHYVYCEWAEDINGRYVQSRWNPVFEYQVDDSVYMVELEIMALNNRFDVDEVEVQFLPSNPEICFIKGIRGKIRNQKRLVE